MYQCPNCGGRLIFDISSQSMLCEHCNTHYNPYKLGEGNSAEENKEYDVTVFKCPQCGGEIMSTDNTIADFCSFFLQLLWSIYSSGKQNFQRTPSGIYYSVQQNQAGL